MGMESKHLHYLKHQLVTASTSNASLSACLNVPQHWKIGDTSSCKKLRTQLVQAQMCMCIYKIYIYIILYIILYIHHLHKVVNKHQSGVSLFFLNRFWLPVSWLVVVSHIPTSPVQPSPSRLSFSNTSTPDGSEAGMIHQPVEQMLEM